MIRSLAIIAFVSQCNTGWTHAKNPVDPADAFDLSRWKLQIPGPKEVKNLQGYSSEYFQLNERKEMCFILDASEQGTTPNTKYVRSELRHIPNWKVVGDHRLTAVARVESALKPDKVTVLQIHGITGEGDNAPPFLRIAVQHGDLFAFVKRSATGDKTDSVLLKKKVRSDFFQVVVDVKDGVLSVAVDGKERLRRDAEYWKVDNYFKAGCYPQALEGKVKVLFRELSAR